MIICDLDGTLALLEGRDPFTPQTILTDKLNEPVAAVLRTFAQAKEKVGLIIISGRFERYREETRKWLVRHGIEHDELHLRGDRDFRKDIVYKRAVYEEKINSKYEVLLVLEDRGRMVKAWREMGLACFQVREEG